MKRMKNIFLAVSAFLMLSLLTACAGENKSAEPPDQNRNLQIPETQEPAEPPDFTPVGQDKNLLSQQAQAICGSYFKAGDFTYRMNLAPGEPDERHLLSMTFLKKDRESIYEDWSSSLVTLFSLRLPYEAETKSYLLEGSSSGGSSQAFTVEFGENGAVALLGDSEAAGLYYACEKNLSMPEAFERPLNAADLIGLDKVQIQRIRNEFYAVYGRKFNSDAMKAYFESKPWYLGTVEADSFQDSVLGGLFRRNIAFLKAAEDAYNEQQAMALREAYGKLPPAAYLPLLPRHGEISVSISSKASQAEDMGIYYAAQGTISVPVSITAIQREALDNGRELEIDADDGMGEDAVLKKNSAQQYLLAHGGSQEEVFLSWEPYSNHYVLWRGSADTLFRQVYEGEIRVLKGACEEYTRYFDLPDAKRAEAPGDYRVMDFDEPDSGEPEPYRGNLLLTDSNGYVKALYFRGD